MKKYKCLVIIFICWFDNTSAQNANWNLLIDEGYHTFLGNFVAELDSFYCIVGTAVDTVPTYEQGFAVSFVDKKTGKSVFTNYYGEFNTDLDMTRVRNLAIDSSRIIIPLTKGNSEAGLHILVLDINKKNYEKILIIPSPEIDPNFIFLSDFILHNDCYYILCGIQTKDKNEPMIIKVNKNTLEYKFIRWKDKSESIIQKRMTFHSNGIIVFSEYNRTEFLTYGNVITFMDLDGNVVWEQKSPGIVYNSYVNHILSINDKEILVTANDPIYDYVLRTVTSRFSVMKYNTETQKTIWYKWWDEPRKEYLNYESKILKGKIANEYLLMANDIDKSDTTLHTLGKIVCFTDNGSIKWKKTYVHTAKWAVHNEFRNMIETKDGNYLISGWEGLSANPWLVKIDEDGNILPIDTTSSTGDIYSTTISLPEIKVYPNPASHTIIINQGEITDMTYLLTDIHGRTIKSMPLPDAHHHVVWDISDVASGTYVLQMRQGDMVIGTKQIVVVK